MTMPPTALLGRGVEYDPTRDKRLAEKLRIKLVNRSIFEWDGPLTDDRPCWLWTGAKAKNGYGSIVVGRKTYYAHRISYEVHRGQIPEGKQLDHLCRVRHCVNPWHLEPVTHAENGRRGSRAKLTREEAEFIRASDKRAVAIAEDFGISPKTVWAIRKGTTWT